MTTDLATRVAAAVTAVPGVAYLSPHPRTLLTGFGRSEAAGRGVTVRAQDRGYTIEIRIAVRDDTPALATTRAVRDAAYKALAGSDDPNTDASTTQITISVTVTALI